MLTSFWPDGLSTVYWTNIFMDNNVCWRHQIFWKFHLKSQCKLKISFFQIKIHFNCKTFYDIQLLYLFMRTKVCLLIWSFNCNLSMLKHILWRLKVSVCVFLQYLCLLKVMKFKVIIYHLLSFRFVTKVITNKHLKQKKENQQRIRK